MALEAASAAALALILASSASSICLAFWMLMADSFWMGAKGSLICFNFLLSLLDGAVWGDLTSQTTVTSSSADMVHPDGGLGPQDVLGVVVRGLGDDG